MKQTSFLDTSYRINPCIATSIRSAGSMTVFGTGAPLELPIDLFRVLMTFADKTTARDAFQILDVDVDIDEFDEIVVDLCERGLLQRELPADNERGLQDFLNPRILSGSVSVGRIGDRIREGRAVIIPDALPIDLAERVYRDLDASKNWTPSEGGHDFFHYRACAIDNIDGKSPALTECSRLFTTRATRRFIGEISGQDCAGEAGVAAAWYRPGEYALPHDDTGSDASRSVAYIWYLTKDWRQEWGGGLFWCPTGQYIRPKFNTLLIFRVMTSNVHFVCPVALSAGTKRLTINGFWVRAQRKPASSSVSVEAAISPRAYGHVDPGDFDLLPAIVL